MHAVMFANVKKASRYITCFYNNQHGRSKWSIRQLCSFPVHNLQCHQWVSRGVSFDWSIDWRTSQSGQLSGQSSVKSMSQIPHPSHTNRAAAPPNVTTCSSPVSLHWDITHLGNIRRQRRRQAHQPDRDRTLLSSRLHYVFFFTSFNLQICGI